MKKLLIAILLSLIATLLPNIANAQQAITTVSANNTLTATNDFVEFVLPIGTPSTETVTLTLTGTFVSINRVDASALNNNWVAGTFVSSIPVVNASDNSSSTTISATGTWVIGNVGWQRIRVFASTFTSGTVTVTAVRGFGGVSVGGGGGGGGTGDFTNTVFNASFGTTGAPDAQVSSVQGISGMTPLDVNCLAGCSGGGGASDFTNAVFNASFGTAGTPDSQIQSVQGITGMVPLNVGFSGQEVILHATPEPTIPYLVPVVNYNSDGTISEFGTLNYHNNAPLVNQDGIVNLCKSWPGAPTALSFNTNLSMFNCTPEGKLRVELSDVNSIPLIVCNQQLTGASSADAIAIPLSGSLTTYICSMHIDAEGTVDTRIVSGTTGACTASITQMSALYAFSTTTGVLGTNEGSGIGMIMKSDPGEDVCIDVSGAVVNNWRLTYTQF